MRNKKIVYAIQNINGMTEFVPLPEPKKQKKPQMKFWDRFRLSRYSNRLLILVNQIDRLERYSKKTKSFQTRCLFLAEIAKLQIEFDKYESKCREIEDKYFARKRK